MYQTIQVNIKDKFCKITLSRPEARNSLNETLITELTQAIQQTTESNTIRMIILQGLPGVFCTGLDFKSAVSSTDITSTDSYMTLLHLIATIPRIVVAAVDGVVMAGGIGIVAACDLVFATPQSQFSLPEALWGLLPCCVAPYLIRRIGFHQAYKMTLTTQTFNAEEAARISLVDTLSSELESEIHKQAPRLLRMAPQTIDDLKKYYRKLWMINEEMEAFAINEISRLMQTPRVQQNLSNFVQLGKFPWE